MQVFVIIFFVSQVNYHIWWLYVDITILTLQGMCFSLPTPEDPFNNRHDKKNFKRKGRKNKIPSQEDEEDFVKGEGAAQGNEKQSSNLENENVKVVDFMDDEEGLVISVNDIDQKCLVDPEEKVQVIEKEGNHGQDRWAFENSTPSKFLFMCLNSIENALRHDGTYISEEEKPLFVNDWGVEFWKCYSAGKDILETSGVCSSIEQIAWIVSIAADTIARKEKEGQSFASPFLLFLVPSQEKAAKVCEYIYIYIFFTILNLNCYPSLLLPNGLFWFESVNIFFTSQVSTLIWGCLEILSFVSLIDIVNA